MSEEEPTGDEPARTAPAGPPSRDDAPARRAAGGDEAERLTAAQIDQLTPLDRNRYADLLRLAAIAVVVLGHWMVAVVLHRDGELVAASLLELVPQAHWATWVVQVMPIFFFVGGYANAAAWSSARGRGVAWADWVRRRARRLTRPVLPLVALWVPLGLLLGWLGVPGELLQLASQVAFVPAWFLATYLLVVALVPLTTALHRRWGFAAVAGLVVAAIVVDLAHTAGVPAIGWANFVFVWGAIHQLGYLWYDQRLPAVPWQGLVLAAGAVALLVALVTVADYPVSMVGVEGAERSNNSPPTIALIVLALGQVGIVAALRGPAERWLARPAVWAKVAIGGSVAMTVYLWHMTALVLLVALTHPFGLWPVTAQVDGSWWALRPLWIGLLALVLALLVRLFARFERTGPPRSRPSRVRAMVGLAATVLGMGLLVAGGLIDPTGRLTAVPLLPLGLFVGGLGALGVLRADPPLDAPDPADPPEVAASAREAR